MSKRRIFIGIPTYDGKIGVSLFYSLAGLFPLGAELGLEFGVDAQIGDSHVDRARNYIVDHFLKSDSSHLLFVDNDLGFDPRDLVKMCALDHDIVGVPYPKKEIDWAAIRRAVMETAPANELDRFGTKLAMWTSPGAKRAADGTIECDVIATGLMLIRREVFERMDETTPLSRYATGEELRTYFDAGVYDIRGEKRWLSEDYAFCHKATSIGIKPRSFCQGARGVTHHGAFAYRAMPRMPQVPA